MRRGLMLLLLASLSAHAGESAPKPADELAMGEGVSITVYNQDFAVVKERRFMELKAGRQTIKFTNIAQYIEPETVQFSSLTDPAGTRVAEQNYEFDLVSADKLMHKYIDRKLTIVTQDGKLIEGYLMSFDGGQIVVAQNAQGDAPQIIPRADNVTDVRFASLPEGLLTKPTLVWGIDAKKAGKHLVKVAYVTKHVKWHAEYTAIAADADTRIDMSGWVSVDNRSGTTYADAGVKLMAGDVHRVVEPPRMPSRGQQRAYAKGAGLGGGFEEKTFSEYHLYTLGRSSTLADRQIKQIELLTADAVPVTKVYEYRGGTHAIARLRFKNDKKSHMGMPLPKGKVRVYKRDTDGELEFIGDDSIDHTPKDEKVHLTIGKALQIVGERKETAQRRPSRRSSEHDMQIRLRNHKDTPVSVNIEETLQRGRDWQILLKSDDYEKVSANQLRFAVDIPANTEKVVTYTVRYSW